MVDHAAKGAARETKASIKQSIGQAIGSEKLQNEAAIEKADAEAEQRYGEAADEAKKKGVKLYTS